MILDLLRNRETSRFFVAALLRMTLRQVSMATGGKGYPNFRRSARRSRRSAGFNPRPHIFLRSLRSNFLCLRALRGLCGENFDLLAPCPAGLYALKRDPAIQIGHETIFSIRVYISGPKVRQVINRAIGPCVLAPRKVMQIHGGAYASRIGCFAVFHARGVRRSLWRAKPEA